MEIKILEHKGREITINNLIAQLSKDVSNQDVSEAIKSAEDIIDNNKEYISLWNGCKKVNPENAQRYDRLINEAKNYNKILEECIHILNSKLTIMASA